MKMAEMNAARRALLRGALAAPWVLLGVGVARAAAPAKGTAAGKCVNLADLPDSQQSLRQSVNFHLTSPEPDKRRCELCAFFTATEGGCGQCQLFSGGPVASVSVCDSFAAKA